jgi:predicted AAA+ superfamily ATPase
MLKYYINNAMILSMKRYALDTLKQWKNESNRKPLVIRGARQVGKTELVRIFARQEFESFIEINFDEHPSKASLFVDDDILNVIRYIEIDSNMKISPGKTLLFLDEIQAAPSVLSKLRYFYERIPQLHVIGAGSLLDFALSEPECSTPVGRIEFFYLGPMTFGEFLLARGQEQLENYLTSYSPATAIPEAIHTKLRSLLREYFLTGGLPGVVKAYTQSDLDLETVAREQHSILQTLYADFGKYKQKVNVPFLQGIFRNIPAQVGKTVKYSSLNLAARSYLVKESLDLLEKARLIHRIFHSDGNGIPLGAEVNPSSFKLIFLDTGLLSAFLGLKLTDFMPNEEYTLIHSGAVAEQFVGQHLLYAGAPWAEPSLYYWNRQNRASTAEVDYLIQHHTRIIPIEVKAGTTGRLKSLHMFVQEKRAPLALRFNTDLPSIHATHTAIAGKESTPFTLLSLPLYLVEQTQRLVGEIVSKRGM